MSTIAQEYVKEAVNYVESELQLRTCANSFMISPHTIDRINNLFLSVSFFPQRLCEDLMCELRETHCFSFIIDASFTMGKTYKINYINFIYRGEY